MRTLWLLRHARAREDGEDGSDHERALLPRGSEAATRLGRQLAARGAAPELALCSSAVRARETLAGLLQGIGAAVPSEVSKDLYLASAPALARRIGEAPETARSLLVVGHNPGIGELAVRLAQRGDPALRAALARSFPPCALAELHLDAAGWEGVTRGGELARFDAPGASGA